MYSDPYNLRHPQPWRDVMQVCLNGHVINTSYQKYPQYNKEYCDKCGEKTIINCQNCAKPIPGDMQDTGVVSVGYRKSASGFCQHCGENFPWFNKNEINSTSNQESSLVTLERIFSNFHNLVRRLRNRHANRETLDITDEYDVQDLLNSLLILFFNDIRPEEVTPSYAGKSGRIDFLLKKERVAVEVKMTRQGLGDKQIGDQLLVDIERYKEHPDCSTLVCFVYDPEGRINNQTVLYLICKSSPKKHLML